MSTPPEEIEKAKAIVRGNPEVVASRAACRHVFRSHEGECHSFLMVCYGDQPIEQLILFDGACCICQAELPEAPVYDNPDDWNLVRDG